MTVFCCALFLIAADGLAQEAGEKTVRIPAIFSSYHSGNEPLNKTEINLPGFQPVQKENIFNKNTTLQEEALLIAAKTAAYTAQRIAVTANPKPVKIAQYTSGTSLATNSIFGNNPWIQVYGRYDTSPNMELVNPPDSAKSYAVFDQGVTLVLTRLPENPHFNVSTVDISADRVVVWMANTSRLLQNSDKKDLTLNDLDIELYLEGNIVFREGDNTIFADKMYYDVAHQVGVINDAELFAAVPGYDGTIRVMAKTIRQTGPNTFSAYNSMVTSSEMGLPDYGLRSSTIRFENKQIPVYNSLGVPVIDPETGKQWINRKNYIVAEQNRVEVGGFPVFYWPWMAMNTQQPTMYLTHLSYSHNSMFGHKIQSTWNLHQMFNMQNPPEGTDWELNIDYLSERGLGHGMEYSYNRDNFLGITGPAVGFIDYWGIYDRGADNIGLGRRNLTPEEDYRYRFLWRHRQFLHSGFLKDWLVTAEVGKSSDRNFLNQYYENEWNTFKNESTGIELKKTVNNQSLAISADYNLNNFYTQTDNLPRLDHFWLGQTPFNSLFGDSLTWYEHTKAGFQSFQTLDSPEDMNDAFMFRYLPWEVAAGSPLDPNSAYLEKLSKTRETFATRHEIDMPFQLGPVKCVPYLLGEFAHWGTDRENDSVQRLYGVAGFRANLPFWKVNPEFSSDLFYLNGLSHKIDLGVDVSYASANQPMEKLILYDALDDNAVQDFRRRYSVTTFGNNSYAVPLRYDERYYALRSGLQNMVTSPSMEIAGDLALVRFSFDQRWQTKRGPANKRRPLDWITFDTGLNLYPKKEQNFGKTVGLIDYDFRWQVGDRFSVLSSGLFDTFTGGQSILRLGGLLQRPRRGSLYVGVDRLDGPFSRTYLNTSMDYRLSEKWSTMYSTSFDLTNGENMGHRLVLARNGESFQVRVGASYDWSRNVWSFSFGLDPIFLAKKKDNRLTHTM
ncbi:MAG: hypothetical protein LBQ54_02675 [Planctomycetaceae bacterium]|nr:hypothetical protein [Planctomycetaceae bacterium]